MLRYAVAGAAFVFVYLTVLYLTLPDVRPLAAAPPETTAFIELRARQARGEGKAVKREQRWVPYQRISPTLKRAVLVAEDSGFFDHEGFDFEQIRASIEVNLERFELSRGASTITQQLAKNLYLSPSKNPTRKFRELLITRLLEAALTKRRIFELYLNAIEWGDGIYGAEAAARAYFATSAASLSAEQSALLAGALINPRVYSPAAPPRRLLARQRIILGRMQRGAASPPARSAPAPPIVSPTVETAPEAREPVPETPPVPDTADAARPQQ